MEQTEISTYDLEQEWISKFDINTGRLKENLSNECYLYVQKNQDRIKQLESEMIRGILFKQYDNIITYLKQWVDIPEDQMKVIAIWIIGTYFHKQFSTFPYLFFNAMRGSGKTRLLTIISWLQNKGNGQVLNNPSEPVLFRTAEERGIILDEFESQKSKDKQTLREYMNACYKKGGMVYRMEKQKIDNKEQQVAKGYPLYTPVAMANINGIESVLSDRSITLILEKSSNPYLVKKIESFDNDIKIKEIKDSLMRTSCIVCSVYPLKNTIEGWNSFVESRYSTSIHTIHTIHNSTTLHIEDIYKKIDSTGIFGRNLELFFPLMLVAEMIGATVFDEIVQIVSKMNVVKKEDEFTESKDVSLIEFIANRVENRFEPILMHELFNEYQMFAGVDKNDKLNETNITWFGLALKRLSLVTWRKRVNKGVMILLNVDHAKEKLKIFKEVEAEVAK
ncbi:MAG: hypothetical protein WCK29_01580 [archaeon]